MYLVQEGNALIDGVRGTESVLITARFLRNTKARKIQVPHHLLQGGGEIVEKVMAAWCRLQHT